MYQRLYPDFNPPAQRKFRNDLGTYLLAVEIDIPAIHFLEYVLTAAAVRLRSTICRPQCCHNFTYDHSQ
jgi:hypothetical protein